MVPLLLPGSLLLWRDPLLAQCRDLTGRLGSVETSESPLLQGAAVADSRSTAVGGGVVVAAASIAAVAGETSPPRPARGLDRRL